MQSSPLRPIRFATFEADPATGELRKAGKLVSIQEQPFRLLILLLELWICPVDGGPTAKLSALPNLKNRFLFGQVETVTTAWFEDQIILSFAMEEENSNLWTARIAPERRRLSTELKRITLGSTGAAGEALCLSLP